MNNRKITLFISAAVTVQAILIFWFATSGLLGNFQQGWSGIISSSLPFVPAPILIGYLFSRYKGISDWIEKHRILTAIPVFALLYTLSVFLYVNATILVRW